MVEADGSNIRLFFMTKCQPYCKAQYLQQQRV